MYDRMRAAYRFHCPHLPGGGRRLVRLSAFRSVERLAGAAHPAVFRVAYACACGDDHVGLVDHGDLDTVGAGAEEVRFTNLMTGRAEPVTTELDEIARFELGRGNWPWRLYCVREASLKPVFPSSLTLVAPAARGGEDLVGVAVRCPTCGSVSVNLVSCAHLDVPFHHDRVVRFVDRPFGDGRDLTLERFHQHLYSASFDADRARLG
jgi:hypothetical protein